MSLSLVETGVPGEKPLRAKLRTDYFSLSLFLCLQCLKKELKKRRSKGKRREKKELPRFSVKLNVEFFYKFWSKFWSIYKFEMVRKPAPIYY